MTVISPRRILTTCVGLMVALPATALACPVCFGESDAPLAQAMNQGIMFMLAIIVSVLAGFGAFIVYLMRRAASMEREGAPAGHVTGRVGHAGQVGP
jgi:hypothetical protein